MSVWSLRLRAVAMQKIVDAEEILKFLLGIIVIIRRKFEKKIWTRMWSRSTCNWKTSER
jgi:hypothetical protein